jgi:protein pelota
MENFFQSVYQAILRLIPFQTLKAIVIASPGFTKESVCPPSSLLFDCSIQI